MENLLEQVEKWHRVEIVNGPENAIISFFPNKKDKPWEVTKLELKEDHITYIFGKTSIMSYVSQFIFNITDIVDVIKLEADDHEGITILLKNHLGNKSSITFRFRSLKTKIINKTEDTTITVAGLIVWITREWAKLN